MSSVRVLAIEMFEVMAIMCRLFIGKYAVSHENGQTEITTSHSNHTAHTRIITLQMLSTFLTTEREKVFSIVTGVWLRLNY